MRPRPPRRRLTETHIHESHFLDRLTLLQPKAEPFAGGHGVTTDEDRGWEDGYRQRWQHDKIVRSTHGVNCTGSCSWKIYVKGGIVTWETQQTDYPAHAAGPAEPRAARLRARRLLLRGISTPATG
jgi:nitrate reductase alpha subunit